MDLSNGSHTFDQIDVGIKVCTEEDFKKRGNDLKNFNEFN